MPDVKNASVLRIAVCTEGHVHFHFQEADGSIFAGAQFSVEEWRDCVALVNGQLQALEIGTSPEARGPVQ